MSFTQFSMVEELASLVKDNLPCKHLILSMEEALVNFLQHDTSSDGVLELEPTNAYNRLLLHRLADIFGFSHHSVGEGDDRHLILERCPETSIPGILVSDLLWQYDELQSPKVSDVLSRKKEASSGPSTELPSVGFSLEREAAYLLARARIYSLDDGETRGPVKQRPQNDPIVARRMIAHALGQRIKPSNGQSGEQDKNMNTQDKEERNTNLTMGMARPSKQNGCHSSNREMMSDKTGERLSAKSASSVTKRGESRERGNFKEEHVGAAKRMFANALGLHPRDRSNLKVVEQNRPTG